MNTKDKVKCMTLLAQASVMRKASDKKFAEVIDILNKAFDTDVTTKPLPSKGESVENLMTSFLLAEFDRDNRRTSQQVINDIVEALESLGLKGKVESVSSDLPPTTAPLLNTGVKAQKQPENDQETSDFALTPAATDTPQDYSVLSADEIDDSFLTPTPCPVSQLVETHLDPNEITELCG